MRIEPTSSVARVACGSPRRPAAWTTIAFAITLIAHAAHAQSNDFLVKEAAARSGAIGATLGRRVNEGSVFQLLCRGGPGLRVDLSAPWVMQVAGDFPDDIRFTQVSTMTVDFGRTTHPPDFSGRNLQPGQCSPAGFALRDSAPTEVRVRINVGNTWDVSAEAAERLPSTGNIPGYLQDANHYWSFLAVDSGEGYFRSTDSRHWKPEFYKGPATSTIYRPAATAAVLAGRSATTAQAYCGLRGAQSAPDVRIAEAQPGIPVRAVNGDACPGETCRVVSELKCDH